MQKVSRTLLAGVILEGVPWDRIVVGADAQEAAKAEHGLGDLAAALIDHDALNGPNVLAMGVIDIRAFHFVAADEASGLPRFCCHWIAPHSCPVTALRHIHRTGLPWPRSHGFAVPDMPNACLYTG